MSIESKYNKSQGETHNGHRTELISKIVNELGKNDIILLPAGFYKHEGDVNESTLQADAAVISEQLELCNSGATICFGIDSTTNGDKPYKDQLAVAVDRTCIRAIGRKFNAADKEENVIRKAESFNGKEFEKYGRISIKRASGSTWQCAMTFIVFKGIQNPKAMKPLMLFLC